LPTTVGFLNKAKVNVRFILEQSANIQRQAFLVNLVHFN